MELGLGITKFRCLLWSRVTADGKSWRAPHPTVSTSRYWPFRLLGPSGRAGLPSCTETPVAGGVDELHPTVDDLREDLFEVDSDVASMDAWTDTESSLSDSEDSENGWELSEEASGGKPWGQRSKEGKEGGEAVKKYCRSPSAQEGGEFTDSDVDRLSLDQVCQLFPFPLDDFQRHAVAELLDEKSVVVCAPTGAGKTVIAEAATAYFLAVGKEVIYTTPLKALSNQKLYEFRERFGHGNVGLSTGDSTIKPEAPLVVMTAEILRNIMYNSKTTAAGGIHGQERLKNIGLVVLDEVHYMNDPGRGSTWEELIINCPPHIQLLCMSATVANPTEFGEWISEIHGPCTTVTTAKRPVPLRWYFGYGRPTGTPVRPIFNWSGNKLHNFTNKLNMRLLEDVSRWHNTFDHIPSLLGIVEKLVHKKFLPTIFFVFSRRECDEDAMYVYTKGVVLTSEEEQQIIRSEVENLRAEQQEVVREHLVPALVNGIASHHAGCLPGWKSLVENLFQRGILKLVFATETLAAGINMPARSTVISKLGRRRSEFQILTHNELFQMAGRAGRRGYDDVGHCVILESGYEGLKDAIAIFKNGPEHLESRFATGYSLVLNLLSLYSLEDVRQFLSKSFRNYQTSIDLEKRRKQIDELKEKAAMLVKESETFATSEEKEILAQYNSLKNAQAAERRILNGLVEKAVQARTLHVETLLLHLDLPCVVAVDLTAAAGGKRGVQNALLVQVVQDTPVSAENGYELGNTSSMQVLCLTADNQIYQIAVRHVVGVAKESCETPEGWENVKQAIQQQQSVKRWTQMNESVQKLPGVLATARVAIKMAHRARIDPVPFSQEHEAALLLQSKKSKALSREVKNVVKDHTKAKKAAGKVRRQLARAESMLKVAKKAQKALRLRQSQNWRDFKGTMEVLYMAGALERGSLKILPLGEAVKELSGTNALWLAVVLTHPGVNQLSPTQLAALVGVLADPELASKPKVLASFPPPPAVCQIFSELEESHAELCESQIMNGMPNWCNGMIVDVRLCGLVEAWAAGCSWVHIMGGTNMDDGDMARLLTRTLDLLRQIMQSTVFAKSLKATARIAFNGMNRKPIRDLVK